jgi:hypothetical protein
VTRERAEEALLSQWWSGPIGWVFDDVLAIDPPSPCKGKLGLWQLGHQTEREVLIREEAARAA